ncbi:MAG: hypothetical protein K2G03_01395, partial [Bacilli bacterium]|nr:hypothetical protein [Bacilli bacterium]
EIEPYVPHFDEETNIKVMEFGNFLKRMAIDYGKKVPYSTDLLAPFYLNNSAYIGNVENNNIKSLRVHFYDNEA